MTVIVKRPAPHRPIYVAIKPSDTIAVMCEEVGKHHGWSVESMLLVDDGSGALLDLKHTMSMYLKPEGTPKVNFRVELKPPVQLLFVLDGAPKSIPLLPGEMDTLTTEAVYSKAEAAFRVKVSALHSSGVDLPRSLHLMKMFASDLSKFVMQVDKS